MAGLVPAIHVLSGGKKDVDHRDKRGDDGFYAETGWIASSAVPPRSNLNPSRLV
jgi:hypothetical protein